MGDISEHFSRQLDGGLLMTPNCGCRCEKHNKDVGGEDDSQHLLGKAVDLPCRNPWHVYKKLCRRYPDKYGFGVYSWGVHVDVRTEKARWVRW